MQRQRKSLKAPAIIYAQNNPEESYTERKIKYTSSGYSLFTNRLFDSAEN